MIWFKSTLLGSNQFSLFGTTWLDVVQFVSSHFENSIQRKLIWFDLTWLRLDTTRFGSNQIIWFDSTWFGSIRFGATRFGSILLNLVLILLIRLDLIGFNPTRCGSTRPDLISFCSWISVTYWIISGYSHYQVGWKFIFLPSSQLLPEIIGLFWPDRLTGLMPPPLSPILKFGPPRNLIFSTFQIIRCKKKILSIKWKKSSNLFWHLGFLKRA